MNFRLFLSLVSFVRYRRLLLHTVSISSTDYREFSLEQEKKTNGLENKS